MKEVRVHCKICNKTLNINIPEKIIKDSNIPKTPVAYVHNDNSGMNQHCVIAYLDQDFGDRATRIADINIMHLYSFRVKK